MLSCAHSLPLCQHRAVPKSATTGSFLDGRWRRWRCSYPPPPGPHPPAAVPPRAPLCRRPPLAAHRTQRARAGHPHSSIPDEGRLVTHGGGRAGRGGGGGSRRSPCAHPFRHPHPCRGVLPEFGRSCGGRVGGGVTAGENGGWGLGERGAGRRGRRGGWVPTRRRWRRRRRPG